ncbi:MAG: ParB/RepB/Spo0J family partition protein [Opitutales bacterium]|nr:ParB/RepB/Spo0J family partition protein [Opitutales bacterium]
MRELPVEKVFPNPHQPRREFADESLKELAESIRAEGLLQPIVVRPVKEGFQLIAGERRWRACKAIGMRRIPARVMEVSEASAAVLTMIENLQRADLNPIEEALGFASLMRDFDLTQESVSERVGKARASVANALRLLQLDREIQGFLAKGLLSVGHAKVILGLEDPGQRRLLARQIIERGASVREAERLVQLVRRPSQPLRDGRPAAAPEAELAAVADFQRRMASYLNTPVRLKHAPKKGQIVIEYFGNDDLQRIFERMGLGPS